MPHVRQFETPKSNIVRISNLPLDSTKEEIKFILKNFRIQENDVHMLPTSEGGFSGSALVTFPDEMEAQKAIRHRNMFFHRDRYIEMHIYQG